MKILIIEDMPHVVSLLLGAIEQEPIFAHADIDQVATIDTALRYLESKKYHTIIVGNTVSGDGTQLEEAIHRDTEVLTVNHHYLLSGNWTYEELFRKTG